MAETTAEYIAASKGREQLKGGRKYGPEYEHMLDVNEQLSEEFFDDQTHSVNLLRSWFHTSRYVLIDKTARKYYKEGMTVVDMGCGTCNWNKKNLPVIGVDINEKMPKYAKSKGRLIKYYVEDLNHTSLKDNSVDIIIISETLEHIPSYKDVIKELHRMLKPQGIVISTVPYDTNLSLWKPLFAVQCFVQGTLLGKELYKRKCGHVNHFSPASIRKEFENSRFTTAEQFHNKYLTIFTVSRKN
ncbi:class I SAM-dependent methyltransferase [Candidatus Woesearchaeota archaeon]|nr:class I SAM-dependent methyltransferase [Candidatus Woesearchaeota archaeon]